MEVEPRERARCETDDRHAQCFQAFQSLSLIHILIACVGTDAFGDQAVENLVAQGIDAQSVYRSNAATGVAPIWVEADGTNRIAVIPGANDDMDPEQVAKTCLLYTSRCV